MNVRSTNNGIIEFPEGKRLRFGQTMTITKDIAESEMVKALIESGHLVVEGAKAPARSDEK